MRVTPQTPTHRDLDWARPAATRQGGPVGALRAALTGHPVEARSYANTLRRFAMCSITTCLALLGFEIWELVGRPVDMLVPDEIRTAHGRYRTSYQQHPAARSMGRLNFLTARTKSGAIIPVDIALSPLGLVAGHHLTGVTLRDATAQRAAIAALAKIASTDSLTGALNRRSFGNAYEREAERCVRLKQHLFVMLLDIDHFKAVNDTYGHAGGDQALRDLVNACAATLRKTDVLARIGGEEFAILAPAGDAHEALQLAERLRLAIAALSVAAGGRTFNFTISIGMARALLPGESTDAVLARADEALYAAKRTGRDKVVYHP